MKILYLTREFPPHVYGGAGVHIGYLAREMARLASVEVRCFGDQQESRGADSPLVHGFEEWRQALQPADSRIKKALGPVSVNLAMAARPVDADLVHCHTWYSLLAGLWIKILFDIPLVATTHSLEPLRPWKEEQLGRGYQLSSWIEKTALQAADAVIAVSHETRREVLECYHLDPAKVRVIYNGVDTKMFQPSDSVAVLRKYGVPADRPYLLFVGRITRQKGVIHLVRALRHVNPELQAVLCAGAPDTDEIARQMETEVTRLQNERQGVYWIREMVPVPDLVRLYSGAALFVCPSIYEPFGIINLEAMASGCPVVASKVGGIPEAVADGETGLLVPFESRGAPSFEPVNPEAFSKDLAATVNRLFDDKTLREKMSKAGRRRVETRFSWKAIAGQTLDLYRSLYDQRL